MRPANFQENIALDPTRTKWNKIEPLSMHVSCKSLIVLVFYTSLYLSTVGSFLLQFAFLFKLSFRVIQARLCDHILIKSIKFVNSGSLGKDVCPGMSRSNYIRQSQLMWKKSVVIGIGDSLLGANSCMDRFNRTRTGACGEGTVAIGVEDIFLRASVYVTEQRLVHKEREQWLLGEMVPY